MKYLAILIDSFREAIDGKVFSAMVVLSVFLTLMVGSISYAPQPADRAFAETVEKFLLVKGDRGKSILPRPFAVIYTIRDFQTVREAAKPWEGEYAFVLKAADLNINLDDMELDPNAPPKAAKKNQPKAQDPDESDFRRSVAFWDSPGAGFAGSLPSGKSVTDQQMVAFIRDQFDMLGCVDAEVTHRPSTTKGVHEFDVRTKGTTDPRGWPHSPTILFGVYSFRFAQPLGKWVYFIQGGLINGFGAWVALMINVVITAFYIPNMMRKGAIDLLLSKPLMRTTLLIYKYLGGMTLMFLTTSVAVAGMWLVMGLRSGIWGTGFLMSILALTFYFAILYAVSTFTAVFTRSPIVAILVTFFFWFCLWAFGAGHGFLDVMKKEKSVQQDIPAWVFTYSDAANMVIPRTKDLDTLTTKLISQDTLAPGDLRQAGLERITFPAWGEVIGVSLTYIVVLLGFSCLRFATRDY